MCSADALHTVTAAVGVGIAQSSIYDVPGGYKAVMFDRFKGVSEVVRTEASSQS